MDIASTLHEHLSTLEAAGFIRLSGDMPDRTYTFRHALQHDAAYESLLKQNRRELHRSVGMALERLYSERLTELAPELANHFAEAGDTPRALTYSLRAAERAAANYANAEALIYFDRALALSGEGAADQSVPARLVRGRGRVLELSGQHVEAFAAYVQLEQLAQAAGDPSLELDALSLQAAARSAPTALLDLQAGRALADRALALAQQIGDRPAEARIHWNLMLLHSLYQQAGDGIPFGERSLAIARELGLREQLAYSLNDLARGYAAVGQRERALSLLREVEPLWRALGNLPMLADCLASLADTQVSYGQFDEGLASVVRAIEVSQLSGNRWNEAYASGSRYRVLVQRGEFQNAIAAVEQTIGLARQAGLLILEPMLSADLAWMYATLGDITRALALCEAALVLGAQMPPMMNAAVLSVRARIYARHGDPTAGDSDLSGVRASYDPTDYTTDGPIYVAWAAAELERARGDPSAAVAALEPVVAEVRRISNRYYLPMLLYELGLAQLQQDRLDEAEAALEEARSEAEAMRAQAVLWPVLAAQATVAARRGNASEADTLRTQARAIIAQLAAPLTDEALRASFLAQAAVALKG